MSEENNERKVPPIEDDNAADIVGQRLSEGQGGSEQRQETHVGDELPEAETSLPFDVTKLTEGQMQELKARLNVTPDRVTQKRANPTVLIRRFGGAFVTDIGTAIDTLVRDEVTNITKEVVLLPIKLYGSDEWVRVDYKEFMQSEQVKCEVLSMESTPGHILEEGTVVSRETGLRVQREITTVEHTLVVKLPDGAPAPTMTVSGKIANA